MPPESEIVFGPFRLEPMRARLWQGEQAIPLRPRTFAVLHYLVQHPGRLMTKEELRQQVWKGTYVTDTVLRVCIREIRAALGDTAATPQYIETVGGQGYRFCGRHLSGPFDVTTGPVVGRQRELAALAARFQQAASGQRQCLLLSGEPGVGKTTIVQQWLSHLTAHEVVRIGVGQCGMAQGEGEAYQPILEALVRLGRGPDGDQVLTVLRRVAPMWLVHLPALVRATEREQVQRQIQGATAARMVRELCDALEVLTAEVPLVLVLEDLHWSDTATVEAVTALARRQEPARLLVVGTYRLSEVVVRQHPLRGAAQELRGHGQCAELPLELLTAEDVVAYVAERLGGIVSAALATRIYERTEGNALFMVNVLAHLVHQGLVVQRGGQWTLLESAEAALQVIPEGLRQFILRRIEAFTPEVQRLLDAASAVGEGFAVAAVAAGMQQAAEEVETTCEALAAQSLFLEAGGLAQWPDGTVSGQYRFRHALYRQVLYERLGAARRVQLHRRIGERLEVSYAGRTAEIAAELAWHFAQGHDPASEVRYRRQAGEQALRRFAYAGAIAHLQRGLALLEACPEEPQRWQQELLVQIRLGSAFLAARGYTAPETEQAFNRALILSQQTGDLRQTFPVQHGLFQYYYGRGQHATARAIAEQLLQLARTSADPTYGVVAHRVMGAALAAQGELGEARWQVEQSLAFYTPEEHEVLIGHYGLDFRVFALSLLTLVLWLLGFPEQARQQNVEALRVARALGHPFSQGQALLYGAIVQQCSGDVPQTQALAEALIAVATEYGFPLWRAAGQVLRSWALAVQGQDDGATQVRQEIATYHALGVRFALPYGLTLLASLYGRTGQPEVGLATLEEALDRVQTQGEYVWQAELFRLKGELLLLRAVAAPNEAEACFQQALTIARTQHARAWELRAATSLARLWQQQGKRHAAHQLLAEIYGWFTEGFGTADLQAARALLEALA